MCSSIIRKKAFSEIGIIFLMSSHDGPQVPIRSICGRNGAQQTGAPRSRSLWVMSEKCTFICKFLYSSHPVARMNKS